MIDLILFGKNTTLRKMQLGLIILLELEIKSQLAGISTHEFNMGTIGEISV
jgi:hypothetical protein